MENAGSVIGYKSSILSDLFFQGISMVSLLLWIVIIVLLIRLMLLGIKALKIYIKKNNQ